MKLLQISPLNKDSKSLPDVIRKCCKIKADVVANDEKETASFGGRAFSIWDTHLVMQ